MVQAHGILKNPTNQTGIEELEETRDKIKESLKSIQDEFKRANESAEDVIRNAMVMIDTSENSTSKPDKASTDDFATLKPEIMAQTKEVYKLSQEIVTKANTDPSGFEGILPKLAGKYHQLTATVKKALMADYKNESARETTAAVQVTDQIWTKNSIKLKQPL